MVTGHQLVNTYKTTRITSNITNLRTYFVPCSALPCPRSTEHLVTNTEDVPTKSPWPHVIRHFLPRTRYRLHFTIMSTRSTPALSLRSRLSIPKSRTLYSAGIPTA